MIKNIGYMIFGIYMNQEYPHLMPNIKNHYYHLNNILLNNYKIKNNNCPIIKFFNK